LPWLLGQTAAGREDGRERAEQSGRRTNAKGERRGEERRGEERRGEERREEKA
jgi:hypothetical protein